MTLPIISSPQRYSTFSNRMRSREPMGGIFLRSADSNQVEIFGIAGVDMVCLDTEHAVYDRSQINGCVLAARATDIPCLVRVPALEASVILAALDVGATGVLVPHMRTCEELRELARICHFGRGGRGFSTSSRAAAFGFKSRDQILSDARTETCVLAMLEDPEVLENLEEIIRVEGIDGYFLGLADLSVALGVEKTHPRIEAFIAEACQLARRFGKALGLVIDGANQASTWIERGFTYFLIGSDYALLSRGARQLKNDFPAITKD